MNDIACLEDGMVQKNEDTASYSASMISDSSNSDLQMSKGKTSAIRYINYA